ncbi:hypothetical protein DF3PB_4670002 [uncultured Defluviicoccus sp.]|uniref:Uncharacterized protein n=1 Tax=metagenome TaxID=256318 RepID=A0A380TIW9_9ZZZZ|nr:hypothetical protein DF3PB_4670002 [uncultured Defluviicoccus sp.]
MKHVETIFDRVLAAEDLSAQLLSL